MDPRTLTSLRTMVATRIANLRFLCRDRSCEEYLNKVGVLVARLRQIHPNRRLSVGRTERYSRSEIEREPAASAVTTTLQDPPRIPAVN